MTPDEREEIRKAVDRLAAGEFQPRHFKNLVDLCHSLLADCDRLQAEVERLREEVDKLARANFKLWRDAPCGVPGHVGANLVDRRKMDFLPETKDGKRFWSHDDQHFFEDFRQHNKGGRCLVCADQQKLRDEIERLERTLGQRACGPGERYEAD